MTEWVTTFVETVGYPGIFVLMVLEVPIPLISSEIVMAFSGFTAGRGDLHGVGAALAGVAGSQTGSVALFALCRRFSEDEVEAFLTKYGGWFGVDEDNLERGQQFFRRHDHWAVLIGRFVPGLRSAIAIPAGILRMPYWEFFALNLVGVVCWVSVLTFLGSVLGDNYDVIDRYSSYVTYGMVGALAAYVLYRVVVVAKGRVTAD